VRYQPLAEDLGDRPSGGEGGLERCYVVLVVIDAGREE
jgi:hypothetical protein